MIIPSLKTAKKSLCTEEGQWNIGLSKSLKRISYVSFEMGMSNTVAKSSAPKVTLIVKGIKNSPPIRKAETKPKSLKLPYKSDPRVFDYYDWEGKHSDLEVLLESIRDKWLPTSPPVISAEDLFIQRKMTVLHKACAVMKYLPATDVLEGCDLQYQGLEKPLRTVSAGKITSLIRDYCDQRHSAFQEFDKLFLQKLPPATIEAKEIESNRTLMSLKKLELDLMKTIVYPPSDANIQQIIDFLYTQCSTKSKQITVTTDRSRLKEMVDQWSHFLRIWRGSLAYVPLF